MHSSPISYNLYVSIFDCLNRKGVHTRSHKNTVDIGRAFVNPNGIYQLALYLLGIWLGIRLSYPDLIQSSLKLVLVFSKLPIVELRKEQPVLALAVRSFDQIAHINMKKAPFVKVIGIFKIGIVKVGEGTA